MRQLATGIIQDEAYRMIIQDEAAGNRNHTMQESYNSGISESTEFIQ